MTNLEIGERIRSRRVELGLTLDDVAFTVGVNKTTIQRYESGKITSLKMPVIQSIAEKLKVNPSWLIGKSTEKSISSSSSWNLRPVTLKQFPMLGEIACGTPIYAREDLETYVDASAEIHADFCLTARGSSMIGAGIHDGDIVFIKEQPLVENGQIAAVIINDEVTLKRWYFYPEKKKLILNPENPEYEPLVFIGEELNEIRCLGRAISFMSNL